MQVGLCSKGELQRTSRTLVVDNSSTAVSLCLSGNIVANDCSFSIDNLDGGTITILAECEYNLCLACGGNSEATASSEVKSVIVIVCTVFYAEVLVILRIECGLCQVVGLDATNRWSLLNRSNTGKNADIACDNIGSLYLNLAVVYPATELLTLWDGQVSLGIRNLTNSITLIALKYGR